MRLNVALVLGAVAVVGVGAIVFGLVLPGETISQPIDFNHAIHLTDAGMECMSCHTEARRAVFAGLPGKEICFDCHDPDEMADEGDDLHPQKARLLPFAESDADIPWVRVALTRPDVFFSHRRHVVSGGLDCLECHVGQDRRTAPPRRAELVLMMTDCIACHERSAVTTDCLACHR